MVEERDANEALLARYIYGNGIDEPLCIERLNPQTSQLSKYLPMQDTNGNVMGLANLTGLLVEKVRYTESGEAVFEYDHVPPQVDVARIASGNLRIRFSEPVDQTKATSAIKVLDGANPIAGTVAFEDEDRLAIFTPTSPLPQAVTLTLKITIDLEDTSGNALTDEFNHTFSYQGSDMPIYDRVPPEVERTEYASGNFSITLTEEYDPTSLANSVEIISPTQTIGGTVTADGLRKLSFSPSQSLQNDTEYTLKVKTSLKDLANKPLTEFTKTFTFDGNDQLIFEKPNQKEHGESYVKNTTLFQGREYDPETGLYYFRARYYAPKLSIFIQPDPMGYEDSMNLYQGFGNNPMNFMDPYGEVRLKSILKGAWNFAKTMTIGAAAIAGVAAVTAISPPVGIALAGSLLIGGAGSIAANRISDAQTPAQVAFGSLADLSGIGGIYRGIFNKEIFTKKELYLSEEQRAESIGTGAGQVATVFIAPKIARSTYKAVRESIKPWQTNNLRPFLAEEDTINRIMNSERGQDLPGYEGVPISRRPTPSELEALTKQHDVEFAVTYKYGPGPFGRGGQYYLHSGDIDSVSFLPEIDRMLISHTHPGGTPYASQADYRFLKFLNDWGSPQKSSSIVPVGMTPFRFKIKR